VEAVKKVLLTTGCAPDEPWAEVLALTHPRMRSYAERNGYGFLSAWYEHVVDRSDEFMNPEPFLDGAINQDVRSDFLRWRGDRRLLAPNWIRYAVAEQLLRRGVDLVVYLDGDVVVMDRNVDVADVIPEDRWLAAPINGPSPDNAGPGGPLWAIRRCPEALAFLEANWAGQLWKTHPNWTDGVDFMALLGYTIHEPVHKDRVTEYDAGFFEIPRPWMAWYPNSGNFVHVQAGVQSGNAAGKVGLIRSML
jgi:hypothetical protein